MRLWGRGRLRRGRRSMHRIDRNRRGQLPGEFIKDLSFDVLLRPVDIYFFNEWSARGLGSINHVVGSLVLELSDLLLEVGKRVL